MATDWEAVVQSVLTEGLKRELTQALSDVERLEAYQRGAVARYHNRDIPDDPEERKGWNTVHWAIVGAERAREVM